MADRVFESPADRYQPRRVVDPPQDVLVDLARLFPPTRVRWGVATPIWVRTVGLQLREPARGVLREWWLTEVGDWVGLVHCEVEINHCRETVVMIVPADALTIAE